MRSEDEEEEHSLSVAGRRLVGSVWQMLVAARRLRVARIVRLLPASDICIRATSVFTRAAVTLADRWHERVSVWLSRCRGGWYVLRVVRPQGSHVHRHLDWRRRPEPRLEAENEHERLRTEKGRTERVESSKGCHTRPHSHSQRSSSRMPRVIVRCRDIG